MIKSLRDMLTIIIIVLLCASPVIACAMPPSCLDDSVPPISDSTDNPSSEDTLPNDPNAPSDGSQGSTPPSEENPPTPDQPSKPDAPTTPDEPNTTPTESDTPSNGPQSPSTPETPNEPNESPEPEHTHNAEYKEEMPATCTEQGVKAHYYCEGCNACFADVDCTIKLESISIPKLGHNFGERIIDIRPTCTDPGSSSRHCSRCSEVTDISPIPELGHDIISEIISSPTCSKTGITLYYCKNCNYAYESTTDLLDHDFEETVIQPSCEQDGYTLNTCSDCGYEYRSDYVSALGHHWNEWVIVSNPSCTKEGLKQRTCANDNTHIQKETLPKAPHEFSDEFEYNDTHHWHNAKCGCDITTEKELHEFTANKCVCGYELHILDYVLSADKQSYAVAGIGTVTDEEIVIPSEYNGLPVVAIDAAAFQNNTLITKVTIPESVTLIRPYAFDGCTSLTSVIFENTSYWFTANSENASNGTGMTVTDSGKNATNIKSRTYVSKFWKRRVLSA